MPTYGYECKSCGHTFDVFQSMRDDPVKVCPECGKEVRRLINGGTGIIFKGSGFYVTDKGKGKGGSTTGPAKADASKPDTSATPAATAASAASAAPPAPAGGGSAGTSGAGDRKTKHETAKPASGS
jgi:putative FmdB family regulatory protein